MTLKKRDGSFSPAKITLLCTVLATLATLAMAVEPAMNAAKKVGALLSVPEKVDAILVRVERIERRMPESDEVATTTNAFNNLTRR